MEKNSNNKVKINSQNMMISNNSDYSYSFITIQIDLFF